MSPRPIFVTIRCAMPELKTRILVVDDDQRLRDLLVRYLSGEGYEVKAVPDAKGMDKQLGRERYDLVVLDLMLPGEDGLAICRRLRSQQISPAIIMLTAKGDDVDRIVGLEMGADDYLPKPFNPRELVARIQAVLRRARTTTRAPVSSAAPLSPERIAVGDVEVDTGTRHVRREGETVELTNVEYEILVILLSAAGRVVTREELVRSALGREISVFDRSIDMHISHLRKKLGRRAGEFERIKTVRGVGYIYARPARDGEGGAGRRAEG